MAAHDDRASSARWARRRFVPQEPGPTPGVGDRQAFQDRLLGRSVLIERSPSGQHGDFLRAARTRARLEHPLIRPVYEVVVDAHGPAVVTKPIEGQSLDEVLRSAKVGGPDALSRNRLLEILARVSLAIDFAHRRGIAHSALSPRQVRIAPLGEIYLAGWDRSVMAVEAARREDLEALAAILFQILTRRPYTEELGRPSSWASDVPPELDRLCVDVLRVDVRGVDVRGVDVRGVDVIDAEDDGARGSPSRAPDDDDGAGDCPSRAPDQAVASPLTGARDFHRAIRRFLDGARDHSLRRRAASREATRAEQAANRALEIGTDEALQWRGEAMSAIGRCLGLDPSNEQAMSLLTRLLATPPAFVPPEVQASIAASHREATKPAGRLAAVACVVGLALGCVGLVSFEILDRVAYSAAFALTAASGLAAAWIARTGSVRAVYAFILLALTNFCVIGRATGHFILIPSLIAPCAVGCSFLPRRRDRAILVGACVTALWAPFVLERLGVLAPTFQRVDGQVQIIPRLVAVESQGFFALVAAAIVSSYVCGFIGMGLAREHLVSLEDSQTFESWQLEQLSPGWDRSEGPSS